jgi:hypothetical protein
MKAFSAMNMASPRSAKDGAPEQENDSDEPISMLTPSSKLAQERKALKVVNGLVIPALSNAAAAADAALPTPAQPPGSLPYDRESQGDTTEKWVVDAPPAQILFYSEAGRASRVSCVKEEDEGEGRCEEDEVRHIDIGSEVWNGKDRGEELHAALLDSLHDKLLPGSAVKCPPGYKGTPAKLKTDCGPTLVVFDQVFEQYQTAKGCQECSARVTTLMGSHGIIRTADPEGLTFEEHAQEAALADILRVHDWEYVSELQRRCANMTSDDIKCLDPPGHPQDTSLSASSYRTAAMAAGAVCKAVDRVMRGECKNAFVAARPPGHHAGPAGLVFTDDGRPSISQGMMELS